jgi:hypothetical protein
MKGGKKEMKKISKKFLRIVNSKPVIGLGIFIMLSLAMVFAGNVIVKEGSVNVDERVGIGTMGSEYKLEVSGTGDVVRVSDSGDSDNERVSLGLASGYGAYFRMRDVSENQNVLVRSYGDSFFNGGNFGIGTISPNSKFQVEGSIATAVTSVTSTYTITASDSVIIATSNYFTINLPTAVGITGREYVIKRSSSNNAPGSITVDGYSTQTIDGSATYILGSAGKYVRIASDGANWIVVGNN